MSSKASRELFSKLERQKIAAVVNHLKKAGYGEDLTKNKLIRHATLEFVEQIIYQLQAVRMKKQEEIRLNAEKMMAEAKELKKERLENEQASGDVVAKGAVQESESSEVQVSAEVNEEVDDHSGTGTEGE